MSRLESQLYTRSLLCGQAHPRDVSASSLLAQSLSLSSESLSTLETEAFAEKKGKHPKAQTPRNTIERCFWEAFLEVLLRAGSESCGDCVAEGKSRVAGHLSYHLTKKKARGKGDACPSSALQSRTGSASDVVVFCCRFGLTRRPKWEERHC